MCVLSLHFTILFVVYVFDNYCNGKANFHVCSFIEGQYKVSRVSRLTGSTFMFLCLL